MTPLAVLIAMYCSSAIAADSTAAAPADGLEEIVVTGLRQSLITNESIKRDSSGIVDAITAEDHPLKKKMAVNSATRLLVITAVALAVAIVFKAHGGIAVFFGLAIFQALLVLSTSLPVLKKIRTEGLDVIDTESKD